MRAVAVVADEIRDVRCSADGARPKSEAADVATARSLPASARSCHLVVAGLLNKQVAFELGISEITVKAHRGRVMEKMRARSFADLVRTAQRVGPEPNERQDG